MDVLRYVDAPLLGLMALLGLLVLGGAPLPALRRGDRPGAVRSAGRALLGGALTGLLAITLMFGSATGHGVNLVPGAGIAEELDNADRGLAVANLVGNVVLFVPLGALAAPVLGWRQGRVVLSGTLLSAAIELTQLVTGRSADVDDVLLNSVGTVIGVLLVRAVTRALGATSAGSRRVQRWCYAVAHGGRSQGPAQRHRPRDRRPARG